MADDHHPRTQADASPSASPASAPDGELIPDPIFLQSLRESGVILLTWLACFAWTFTYCAFNAYPSEVDPASLSTVLGMPAWVVWGIVLPWSLANVVTLVFSFCYMQDADLEDGPTAEQSAAAAAS